MWEDALIWVSGFVGVTFLFASKCRSEARRVVLRTGFVGLESNLALIYLVALDIFSVMHNPRFHLELYVILPSVNLSRL